MRILTCRQTEAWDGVSATIPAYIEVICDDVSELPSDRTAIVSGFSAVIGSLAHVVSNQLDYEMKTDGTWVQKQSQDLVSIITDLSRLDGEVSSLGDDVTDLFSAVGDIRDAVKVLVDNGAKNLIEMTHAAGSITRNGVTCTWDTSAGTMTLSGGHVSTDNASIFEFYSGNAVDQRVIPAGTYHISGCPSGGSTSTYRAALTSITGAVDTGSGATFTITEPIYAAYRILISGNCDFSTPVVFKPMVCYEEFYKMSDSFMPYAPTNRGLYELIRGYHP